MNDVALNYAGFVIRSSGLPARDRVESATLCQ